MSVANKWSLPYLAASRLLGRCMPSHRNKAVDRALDWGGESKYPMYLSLYAFVELSPSSRKVLQSLVTQCLTVSTTLFLLKIVILAITSEQYLNYRDGTSILG